MSAVTKEEWDIWLRHPVTKQFLQTVYELRDEGLEELNSGMHSNDVGKTYLCVGKINTLSAILNLHFQEENK